MNSIAPHLIQLRVYDFGDSHVIQAAAVTGAVTQLFVPDAFFWLFLTLSASNFLDWIFGRHAARSRDRFSRTASRNGLYAKAAQMVILLLLRTLEYILPLTGIPFDTMGIVAAAFALGLIVEDIESLERHIITLTGKPVSGLTPILNRLRAVTGGERRGTRPPDTPSDNGPLERRAHPADLSPEERDRSRRDE